MKQVSLFIDSTGLQVFTAAKESYLNFRYRRHPRSRRPISLMMLMLAPTDARLAARFSRLTATRATLFLRLRHIPPDARQLYYGWAYRC